MRLEAVARKIMMKLKGWDKREMEFDFRDHPDEHRSELAWLVRELEKLQKGGTP